MDGSAEIIERAAQPYVGITGHVPMSGIPTIADRLPEIFSWLGERGVAPAGPPFFRYNVIDMEGELEIEVGVPVASAQEGEGDIRPGSLPAGRYASLTRVGHPRELVAATRDLLEWAQAQGLVWDMEETAAGEEWGARVEFYLTDPAEEPDMDKWEVQLAFRLAE